MSNIVTCDGCKTKRNLIQFSVEYRKCIIVNNAPKRECPCRGCLIKVICIEACEDFNQMISSIFGMKIYSDYKALQGTAWTSKPYYKYRPY